MNVLFIVKLLVSATLIAIATEVAKRLPFWGAVIIALPLTSILAMSWLYFDTRDNALVTRFAKDIFTIVPVSLVFFLPFWLEKKTQFGFVINLLLGLALLALAVWLLRRFLP
ncbi:MAG: DUF3147 family protein [Gammaproteobacteria bacterium]|nr:DUF3147 family protein [Gammaproteobacteria bacterium]